MMRVASLLGALLLCAGFAAAFPESVRRGCPGWLPVRGCNKCWSSVAAARRGGCRSAGGAGRAPERCPGALAGTPPRQKARVPSLARYNKLLKKISIPDVIADIIDLLSDSQPCWPADTFSTSEIGMSYGGLFIRLAWHCSGTFRVTDGVGGCGGGRIRFPPESAWDDNTNLDKARALLVPIKKKYGDGLSWGDLFVLSGTASIMYFGGPVTQVCIGRIDDRDGSASAPLGPGPQQPPCPVQGDCPRPLGASAVGLIYVNPEGFMGIPDPARSAVQIREVFARMGMNDTETVALVGGGHAFGKSHGACPDGAGPGPLEQPFNPWPGNCGTGRGADTFTSGLEGAWTTDPFKWDNEYFTLLDSFAGTYRKMTGPGGKVQWYTPARPELMMQTTDLAFTQDDEYRQIVKDFATDLSKLDTAFAAAWEKLTTRGADFADEKQCYTPDGSFSFFNKQPKDRYTY